MDVFLTVNGMSFNLFFIAEPLPTYSDLPVVRKGSIYPKKST